MYYPNGTVTMIQFSKFTYYPDGTVTIVDFENNHFYAVENITKYPSQIPSYEQITDCAITNIPHNPATALH
jgi:hypothetical protein